MVKSEESMHTASTVSGYWSDQVTSCIARRNGVKEVDLPGLYGWRLCAEDDSYGEDQTSAFGIACFGYFLNVFSSNV